MNRMLFAETAIFPHLNTIRIVPLILHRVVVSLLALGTGQHDFHTYSCLRHTRHLLLNQTSPSLGVSKHACTLYIRSGALSTHFFKTLKYFIQFPEFSHIPRFSHFFVRHWRYYVIVCFSSLAVFHLPGALRAGTKKEAPKSFLFSNLRPGITQ